MSIPVVLHGIYNTLLKQQHDLLALLTAVVSIFFLTYLIRVMHPKPRLG